MSSQNDFGITVLQADVFQKQKQTKMVLWLMAIYKCH